MLGSLTFVGEASAQWTQPANGYYFKVATTAVPGSQGFDREGELFPTESFGLFSLSTYGEYGIAEGNTLTLNGSIGGIAQYGDNTTFTFGPLTLGNRVRLLQARGFSWSTELRTGIDTGIADEDLTAEDETGFVFRPSRGFGLRFEGVTQQGFSKGRFFIGSEFGARFNWYKPDTDFDLIGIVTVGFNAGLNLTPVIFTTTNWALGDLGELNISGAGRTRYVGLGLGVGWWPFERVGFTLTAAGAPYAVINAGAPVFNVGVQFK